ncbi:MAG: hypothetical protein WBJ50_08035, partial [Smithellaceae bacterium]
KHVSAPSTTRKKLFLMPNEGRGDGAVKIIDAGLCRFETQAHDKEKEKIKSRVLPDAQQQCGALISSLSFKP